MSEGVPKVPGTEVQKGCLKRTQGPNAVRFPSNSQGRAALWKLASFTFLLFVRESMVAATTHLPSFILVVQTPKKRLSPELPILVDKL